ncbi:O-antigen ligase family protein [Microbacterium memoriense]|uniref:O-antigen ligase family protein n=1 Tax=Microbacterium memoriense TaxID=2978350 RepID=A0ABT2PFH5_9MICO|nr:O-antigen ligase family protein [Microbacterium memoriense]MCT9002633.1 O-antigen ligase family protein [Microbacterium memoriense]
MSTGNAVTLLTVYIVVLFAVPSNLTVSALGSLGRPSLLWGLCLLLIWLLSRLQRRSLEVLPVAQPVKVALGALIAVALVSFAAAMLRGQPYDQVSLGVAALARLMSWTGVILIAADGLRTHRALSTVIRRLIITASCFAAFGLLQVFAGATMLDWVAALPGVSVELGGIDSRGAFTRAASTATHPLEFTATIAACLPIAVATAVAGGYRASSRWRLAWWVPPALFVVVLVLAVSRSATIGLIVSAIVSIPGLPRAYRWLVTVAGVAAIAAVIVVVPGLFGTVVALFAGAGNDASTTSRTDALARVPEFFAASPWVGAGFGTFTSRYWIFDNQWVQSLIDVGALGLLALVAVVAISIWNAIDGGRRSPYQETRTMGRALAASTLTIAILFLFFDGLSFVIAAGTLFLVVGLCAALRVVGLSDEEHGAAAARLDDFPIDEVVTPADDHGSVTR